MDQIIKYTVHNIMNADDKPAKKTSLSNDTTSNDHLKRDKYLIVISQ